MSEHSTQTAPPRLTLAASAAMLEAAEKLGITQPPPLTKPAPQPPPAKQIHTPETDPVETSTGADTLDPEAAAWRKERLEQRTR
jgi:hypothetical protein